MTQIIENQPHDMYLQARGISSGMIKLCAQKSPLHVWDAYFNPERQDESSEAMDWGRALHEKFLLGDEAFDQHFAMAPVCDKRTKAGKALWESFVEANPGKTVIRPGADADHLERMCASLRTNNLVAARMEGTKRELSCYAGDMKCRFDAIGGYTGIAIDLKTISELTPHAISASIARYGYHIQAAWYLKVAEELGMEVAYDQFCFIFVESKPPYDVAIRLLAPDAIHRGREIVNVTYPVLQNCIARDEWPGFGGEEMVANLPPYAFMEE